MSCGCACSNCHRDCDSYLQPPDDSEYKFMKGLGLLPSLSMPYNQCPMMAMHRHMPFHECPMMAMHRRMPMYRANYSNSDCLDNCYKNCPTEIPDQSYRCYNLCDDMCTAEQKRKDYGDDFLNSPDCQTGCEKQCQSLLTNQTYRCSYLCADECLAHEKKRSING